MYRNLFDKTKKRFAYIPEDYKSLVVHYDFSVSAIFFNKEKVIKKEFKCFDGILNIELVNNKKIIFKFKTGEENLHFLYKIILALAFIFGKNLHLQYYAKNFSYYPLDQYFNLNTHSPVSSKILRDLMENPEKVLRRIINFIEDEESYFNKFFPTLVKVNVFSYQEIIFAVEFGILEKEASKKVAKIEGKIFNSDSDNFKELNCFLDEVKKILTNKYPNIDGDMLKGKLSIEQINIKGTTKEKIKKFLSSFNNKNISECSKYVDTWWNIRNGIIVHGTTNEGLKLFNENNHLVSRLHELLVYFLLLEYNDNLLKLK